MINLHIFHVGWPEFDQNFFSIDPVSVVLHFFQVNGVNIVKVGHKQVVSLIRQGGSRLLMKVVSVTRKPESEEIVRKKGKAI